MKKLVTLGIVGAIAYLGYKAVTAEGDAPPSPAPAPTPPPPPKHTWKVDTRNHRETQAERDEIRNAYELFVAAGRKTPLEFNVYFFRDDGTLAAVRANVLDVTQAAPTARVYKISTFNTYGKDDLPPAGTVAYVPEQSVISTSYGP